MRESIRHLLDALRALERELSSRLHNQDGHSRFRLVGRRVEFAHTTVQAHRKLRMGFFTWLLQIRPLSLLGLPFIYAMIVPLALLDLTITVYQAVCFRLYGIERLHRADYFVIDRHLLAYLNPIEKLGCLYCSYANGLLAYSREIAARTEQYFCPIKHARPVAGMHAHYPGFLDYGDPADFYARVQALREELRPIPRKRDTSE